MNNNDLNSDLIEAASFAPASLEWPAAWCGHLPFAAWLVQTLKPAILVELGTHTGNSYFTFCQAVDRNDLATRCYAVDTWAGDKHAGYYGDEIYQQVSRHNARHYARFSRLMQMTFDDARDYFSDGSVELLHIDGLHTYEAVRHDFDNWLPKLAPGAVVLFHDTNVRERNFGVWKLWEALQQQYPNNMEFTHSHGLGVLQLDGATQTKQLGFLRPEATAKRQMTRYFAALGAAPVQTVESETRTNGLLHAMTERNQGIADLQQSLASKDEHLADLQQSLTSKDQHTAELAARVDQLLNSTSWRMTRPLRLLSATARGAVGKARSVTNRIRVTAHILRRKSLSQLVRRLFVLLRSEGPGGIYRNWKIRTGAQHAATANEKPLVATDCAVTPSGDYTRLASIDIDQYDSFFIDVFDTAIIRLFKQPTDLFTYLGARNKNEDFYTRRIQEEKQARIKSNRKDVSIHDIYARLPDANMEDEIAAELKFCVANPELFAFYQRLVAADKKIYFVSDMYLPQATITEILEVNGYTTYEAVYVSGDDDFVKADGSRFTWLKKTLPGCEKNALHVGDNPISDFEQPHAHGFDALHTIPADDYYRHDPFIRSKLPALGAEQSPGLSFMLATFRYWKSQFGDNPPDYWQQFGFLYGGALVTVFCEFVHDEIVRRQLPRRVYFLARDGDIMTQVFRLLYDDIEPVYLLASRRCMALPAIRDITDKDFASPLRQFSTVFGAECAQDIIERFGYSELEGLESDLAKLESERSQWNEANIHACIERNASEIVPKIKAERSMLIDYLEAQGFFDNETVAIADVGWGGSIQDALERLLKGSGYENNEVHGFYMGIHSDALNQKRKHSWLFKGPMGQLAEYLNLIELLTSSPQDGVIRIGYEDDQYYPVTTPPTPDETRRQHAAKGIQAGIMAFANLIQHRQIRLCDFVHPDDFQNLFSALQTHPSQEDADQLERLRHPMAVGNNYAHRVLRRPAFSL